MFPRVMIPLFLFFLISCTSNQNKDVTPNSDKTVYLSDTIKNGFDSTTTEDEKIDSITYVHSLILYTGKYRIVITETRINDSIHFDYSNIFNQIPLKNHVYFYEANKLISETEISFIRVTAKNYFNKSIDYLDNKISQINLVKTSNKFLILISGYGGCNSCNESTIYFSLSGDLIYFWYGNKNEIVEESISDKITSIKEIEDAKVFDELPF